MEKLLNILKSRFFISALCIFLEFVEIMVVYLLLYYYFMPINILAKLFYVAIFLYIINRDESIEFKLPWIILVLLFPIAGSFMYILLASDKYTKIEQQRFKKHLVKCKKIDNDELKNIKNDEAYSQVKYLCNSDEISVYSKSKVTYYDIGEKFNEALLTELKKAEKFIFMEYFIVENGIIFDPILDVLKEKVSQGVEVYFMYDDFGCMTTLSEKYYKELQSCGINAIPSIKFTPKLSNIHNNRDHRKITVIDGNVGFQEVLI